MTKTHAYTLLMVVALLESVYFLSLSTNSKHRYEAKLSNHGLSVDPYVVKDPDWVNNPAVIPQIAYSDLMLYMTSTPSSHTKEAIKVMNTECIYIFVHFLQAWKGMLDGNGFVSAA